MFLTDLQSCFPANKIDLCSRALSLQVSSVSLEPSNQDSASQKAGSWDRAQKNGCWWGEGPERSMVLGDEHGLESMDSLAPNRMQVSYLLCGLAFTS